MSKKETPEKPENETRNQNEQEVAETTPTEFEPEDKWLIRDCDLYKDEYKECTSFRGRFHQYFIYGEHLDCNQWKHDYNNCCKWVDNNDLKAAEALIKSERQRRYERLRAHYQNDTWKRRSTPPADWNKPLPEWLVTRDENTYLAQKAKNFREGKDDDERSFCSIM